MLISMPSGPSASITSRPTMWRVAAEAASVTKRKSDRRGQRHRISDELPVGREGFRADVGIGDLHVEALQALGHLVTRCGQGRARRRAVPRRGASADKGPWPPSFRPAPSFRRRSCRATGRASSQRRDRRRRWSARRACSSRECLVPGRLRGRPRRSRHRRPKSIPDWGRPRSWRGSRPSSPRVAIALMVGPTSARKAGLVRGLEIAMDAKGRVQGLLVPLRIGSDLKDTRAFPSFESPPLTSNVIDNINRDIGHLSR